MPLMDRSVLHTLESDYAGATLLSLAPNDPDHVTAANHLAATTLRWSFILALPVDSS